MGSTEFNSQQAAQTALAAVSAAIEQVSGRRGSISVSEDKLQAAVKTLSSSTEVSAETSVRSVGAAEDIAASLRSSIIKQATSALTAQANQNPITVAALLGG